jgi:DNA-binding Xre family transcriptional regulator
LSFALRRNQGADSAMRDGPVPSGLPGQPGGGGTAGERFSADGAGRIAAKALMLADVAERMGIDALALSRLESGKMLNPTQATLHKWAEAVGRNLEVDLSPA